MKIPILKCFTVAQRLAAVCFLLPVASHTSAQTSLDYSAYHAIRDDVGYSRLQTQLGANTPDGSGIAVSAIEPLQDALGTSGAQKAWVPVYTFSNVDLNNKIVFNESPNAITGLGSGHATRVARYLFSNNASISPGVTNAHFYNLNHYVENFSGFQHQVNNFSAVGGFDELNSTVLRRFDHAIAKQDMLAIVSSGNNLSGRSPQSPFVYSSSYNGIYVGTTAGHNASYTPPVDNFYSRFRQRPDVVAPEIHTSNATPVVSSIVASLAQAAKNAAFSDTNLSFSRGVYYNAERSEVMKAMVMAGADRLTANTRKNTQPQDSQGNTFKNEDGSTVFTKSDITTYRQDQSVATANGLDVRYGAGQANIYNSYQILAGTEQASREDGGEEIVGRFGFDYDAEFGLGITGHEANSNATYRLPTLEANAELIGSLAWNADIAEDGGEYRNALLYDLDLFLYEITESGEELAAWSASSTANTENIWMPFLEKGKTYEFRITTEKNVMALIWDYGFAWRMEDLDESDLSADDSNAQSLSGVTGLQTQAVPVPPAGWLLLSAVVALFSWRHTGLTLAE